MPSSAPQLSVGTCEIVLKALGRDWLWQSLLTGLLISVSCDRITTCQVMGFTYTINERRAIGQTYGHARVSKFTWLNVKELDINTV